MTRRILEMTYVRVAEGATPEQRGARPRDPGVDSFLLEHFDSMLSRATSNDSPLARFTDPDAARLFANLQTASGDDFYVAAHHLSLRLVGEMDRRSAPGLLLCLRVREGNVSFGAALKLEVVTPNSAILSRLDSGEEVLSSVKNVLDAPGELQKGAVVADPRAGSEVIVGDRLSRDAQYFPRAFGISVDQKAPDGAVDLANVLGGLAPELVVPVVKLLPQVPGGSLADVLQEVGRREPALTEEMQQHAVAVLEQARRPVRRVDTSTALRKTYRVGGVTVAGPAHVLNRDLTVRRRPDGRWELTVVVDEEPIARYSR